MKKTSKPLKLIALVTAIAMVFGCSLAFFTDYVAEQAIGTAGTVAISMDSDINLLDADGRDIINPGDMRDGSFTVTNEGNKSIDVRTTIVLTTQSNAGLDIAFTGDGATQSEYDLYLRDDVELVEGKGYMPKAGAQPLQVKSIDQDVITYVLPVYSLNGNSDKYDEVETIDGVDAFAHDYDFVMIMKGAAGNEWQNSAVQIDVLVEAKQHENTAAGWQIVAQEQIQSGAINQNAVKGENLITGNTNAPADGENKKTYIPVISKNENGDDLNATSSLIEGDLADKLLDALDEQGLANSEDVDLLIDVESDDFDGMADTTFDVSDIAKEGDTVVILHYDEAKQEWEYIATETVDENLTVGGDFSSYSPVGFIVIPKDDESVEEEEAEIEWSDDFWSYELTDGYTFNARLIEAAGGTAENIKTVEFVAPNESSAVSYAISPIEAYVPEGVTIVDMSLASIGSVIAWDNGDGEMIIMAMNGKKINTTTDLICMFMGLPELTHVSFDNLEVPNGTSMESAFESCTNLTTVHDIPVGVTDMSYTFQDCTSLTTAPVIPEGVTDIGGIFTNCTNLETAPEIPGSVTNMHGTFYGCTNLTTAPEIPEGVTDMYGTFNNCTSLTAAPVIPSSVTDMSWTFLNCKSLAGPITINSTPGTYGGCLSRTQITEILGDCDATVKEAIFATK